MHIHVSREWEYGHAQQAAEANGPGQGHHAGETLQPAHRKNLLLLDALLHSLPRGPASRRHGGRGGTRFLGTFSSGAPGSGGYAESGAECPRVPVSARSRSALGRYRGVLACQAPSPASGSAFSRGGHARAEPSVRAHAPDGHLDVWLRAAAHRNVLITCPRYRLTPPDHHSERRQGGATSYPPIR